MSEKRTRPVLSLKSGFRPKAPPPTPLKWKCKPCGATVQPTGDEEPDADIRCPQCNARLGRASDFNARPPHAEKLRARLIS